MLKNKIFFFATSGYNGQSSRGGGAPSCGGGGGQTSHASDRIKNFRIPAPTYYPIIEGKIKLQDGMNPGVGIDSAYIELTKV